MKNNVFFLCTCLTSFLGMAQVFNGSLTLSTQSEIDAFNFTEVTGQLTISEFSPGDIENVEGLITLVTIGGGLLIDGNTTLTSLDGLDNLISVGSTGTAPIGTGEDIVSLQISNNLMLNSIESLSNVSSIGSFLEIEDNASLTSLNGLQGISEINGNVFIINNTSLLSIEGLNNITQVTGAGLFAIGIVIANNDMLLSLGGLDNLTAIMTGGLSIIGNNALTSLDGLSSLETINAEGSPISGLSIRDNENLQSLEGLTSLETLSFNPLIISGNDSLLSLSALSELTNLTYILRIEIIDNDNLMSLEGLENITSTSQLIILENDSLESLEGLNNLTSTIFGINGLRGDVQILSNGNLQSLEGLNNLSEIGVGASSNGSEEAQLLIGNFITADGIIFPGNVSLTSIAALGNLTSVEGTISIFGCNSLQSLDGLEQITNLETLAIGDPALIDNGFINPISNLFNDTLSDLCTITHLATNDVISESEYFVDNNAFNPTFNELLVGNCSSDSMDTDGDGIFDSIDNCVQDSNPDQANNDEDDEGDVCDEDDDNDGNPDTTDPNPTEVVTNPDLLEITSAGLNQINVLENDDFLGSANTSLSMIAGTANLDQLTLDPLTGLMTYTVMTSEAGTTLTVVYEVCHVPTDICDSATVTLQIDTTLSIRDVSLDTGIIVYPNPVKDILYIENPFAAPITSVEVFNLQGQRLIRTFKVREGIDMTSLPSGLYLLEVVVDGKKMVKKIIR